MAAPFVRRAAAAEDMPTGGVPAPQAGAPDVKAALHFPAHIRKVVFACDAGMGSSALGATRFRKRLSDAGIGTAVGNCAADGIPADADVVVCQSVLAGRILPGRRTHSPPPPACEGRTMPRGGLPARSCAPGISERDFPPNPRKPRSGGPGNCSQRADMSNPDMRMPCCAARSRQRPIWAWASPFRTGRPTPRSASCTRASWCCNTPAGLRSATKRHTS